MKNSTLLFTAIAIGFSISSFAQRGGDVVASAELATPQLIADAGISNDDKVVVAYHVEERVIANFGSHTTTYNVSDISLIAKYDLGPNNVRIITPIYGKAKPKLAALTGSAPMIAMNAELPKAKVDISIPVKPVVIAAPAVVAAPAAEKKAGYANIDILKTYERILEKGYKSTDMLKRVANSRFFDGDLAIAAKWYTMLFSITTDLEPVYYYRYAEALKSVGQNEKANGMMKIFEQKSL